MIKIQLKGISAELVLGNYMPKDPTIFTDWSDFYHYNDIIHVSQLLADHIAEVQITRDDELVYQSRLPDNQVTTSKSISPVFEQDQLYLRTECVEEAVYTCELNVSDFDIAKLVFETQDYDMLFKVSSSFLSRVLYNDIPLELEWVSAKPVGNICVLCRFDNGFLSPLYDAVNKKWNKDK